MNAYYTNKSTGNAVGVATLRVSTTGTTDSSGSSSEDGSCTPSPMTPASCSFSQPFPQAMAFTESLLPPADHRLPAPSFRNGDHTMRPHSTLAMTHPYARIYAKKQAEAGKRRKTWNHALEKSILTPHEIATMGAPNRRTIYQASLESYVDQLHERLLAKKLFPVPLDDLEPWKGLNDKTARSMVAGLQHDSTLIKQKLTELERANLALRNVLKGPEGA